MGMGSEATERNMKQRCYCHDYRERGIYMITLETEGRRAVLGRLDGEKIALSPLGETAAACWRQIPRFHPQISLIESVVMPDHFHGLLFVREKMAKHLGEVVRGFKIGCTKGYRAIYGAPPNAAPPSTSLFAPGYHDRILTHKGQLKTLIKYIRDNPKRLAVRRSNPGYFTRINALSVTGADFAAYGNPFLLDRPDKLQIQCSRRISPEALAAEEARLLDAGERGAVLVSPCISPGEKQIARAAMEAGLPLIVILKDPFPPMYKPPGRYFDACAQGKLLMLGMSGGGPYMARKSPITRLECLELNRIAAALCGDGAAKLNYAGIVPWR